MDKNTKKFKTEIENFVNLRKILNNEYKKELNYQEIEYYLNKFIEVINKTNTKEQIEEYLKGKAEYYRYKLITSE